MGMSKTLKVTGTDPSSKKIYQAVVKPDGTLSTHERHFCGHCGSFLYAFDEKWAENVYPFASCIDTDLPIVAAKDQIHIFMDSKCQEGIPIVPAEAATFRQYPNIGIKDWHVKNGLFEEI